MTAVRESLRPAAEAVREDVLGLRRLIHREPEVGRHLPRTQHAVLTALKPLPLELHTGLALSSVTAVLRGTRSDSARRTVLLRADMDALPITESSGLEFASRRPAAHACGHDLHSAILVGTAQLLAARADRLAGDVVFMFQPGEEFDDGAALMIAEGVLDVTGRPADAAYAVHVAASGLPRGVFAGRAGALFGGSATLSVVVRGVGGHGASPHRARDPIAVAAEMITALQTAVTRQFDAFDPVVVTVGRFRGGEVDNVVPDHAEFDATVRFHSARAKAALSDALPRLLHGIAAAHGADVAVELREGYPVTSCTARETDRLRGAVCAQLGDSAWHDLSTPVAGSEDFSRVLDAVPGAMVLLGAVAPDLDPSTAPGNHAPDAVFDDSVVVEGMIAMTAVALDELAGSRQVTTGG